MTAQKTKKLNSHEEMALLILECFTMSDWKTLAELAQACSSGKISHDAWKCAVSSMILEASRCAHLRE